MLEKSTNRHWRTLNSFLILHLLSIPAGKNELRSFWFGYVYFTIQYEKKINFLKLKYESEDDKEYIV
jgi:hypothetical protein